MWQELLKMGLQVGGDTLLPGAGSLGAGILDAAMPAEQPATPVNQQAQDQGDVGMNKLIEVGLGKMPAQIFSMLNKPKQEVMGRSFSKNQQWAQGGSNGSRY